MCEPVTIGLMAAAATTSAVGQIRQGEYEAAVARNNARVAQWQASDAIRRGGIEAGNVQREASSVRGAALAQAGASGVSTTSGSMANMFAAGDAAAAADVATAKYNAALEAWGYKNQAVESAAQARAAREQGRLGAFGSLLGGVGSAAGYMSRRR